ncbi:MAG: NAD(+) synthase [Myxococcota bacterium]
MKGFARISVAVPVCRVADAQANAEAILSLWREAHDAGSQVVAFPELAISSYTARDLFLDDHFLARCEAALAWLCDAGRDLAPLAVVGTPLRVGAGLYNVAAILQGGRVLGLVPKSFLPNYREFEEKRWFRPGTEVAPETVHLVDQREVPFGTDLLFRGTRQPELCVGVELCEDMWVPLPPSMGQVLAGATVCLNLSASNFTVGKADTRRLLARSLSERGRCAYAYVAAGPGESSTDLAFDADAFLCESGQLLVTSQRFAREPQLITADVDLESLRRERLVTGTFQDCATASPRRYRTVAFVDEVPRELHRYVSPHPFLPEDEPTLATRCWEVFEIQTHALVTRMAALGSPQLVLGVSGGIDSTHAALVSAVALDVAKRPRSDLLCVTMPGLGTSGGTRSNAETLARSLGATFLEVPIAEAARVVLEHLGHPVATEAHSVEDLLSRLRAHPELGDVTVENVQARLRTLLLMCLANQRGGLVVGTGDLSEKALGWSTYAGDHIAMYDVNAGVPKTLIQFVIRWVARERLPAFSQGDPRTLLETLERILETPISPELLPPDVDGRVAQLTEDTLGPYELHDFFLFHVVGHGARPARVLDLAQAAFKGRYPLDQLRSTLRRFYTRFFSQQFKRSCTADAPKVLRVALSPRGDWRMPSDASVRSWIKEVDGYGLDCDNEPVTV